MYLGSVKFFRHLILGSFFGSTLLLGALLVNDFVDANDLPSNQIVQEAKGNNSSTNDSTNGTNSEESTDPIDSTEKVAYLTFDDGPSENTVKILDTLKEKNIRATFFVIGEQIDKHPDVVKRMVDEGHTVGIHSNTHDYTTIYQTVDAYIKEIENCNNKIKQVTGKTTKLVRLPGGSENKYIQEFDKELIDAITAKGYKIYDWNVEIEDINSESEAKFSLGKMIRFFAIKDQKTTIEASVGPEETIPSPGVSDGGTESTVPETNTGTQTPSNSSGTSGSTGSSSNNNATTGGSETPPSDSNPSQGQENPSGSPNLNQGSASQPRDVVKEMEDQLGNQNPCIVVMYDGQGQNIAGDELSNLIKSLEEKGYTFDVLDH